MRYIKPLFKTSRWQQIRPVLTFRSTGRSTSQWSNFDRLLLPVDRPVDRALNQRATALGRSTARSTRATREWVASSRSTARSTGSMGWLRARICARPVDRSGRPAPGPVDRAVDRQSLAENIFRTENLGILIPINSNKISKKSTKISSV